MPFQKKLGGGRIEREDEVQRVTGEIPRTLLRHIITLNIWYLLQVRPFNEYMKDVSWVSTLASDNI